MDGSEIDQVDKRLRVAFQGAADRAKREGLDTAGWTQAFAEAADTVGSALGYEVNTHSVDYVNTEWMTWDVAWRKYDGNVLVDLPLVLESQWELKKTKHDFEKLLVSRARLRVMIFGAQNPGEEHFKSFIDAINRYSGTQEGDRYLFVCRCKGSLEFWDHTV